MKKYLAIFLSVVICSSCVSKEKYEDALYEAHRWEEAYNNLSINNSQLYSNYQELKDKYNQLEVEHREIGKNYVKVGEIVRDVKEDIQELKSLGISDIAIHHHLCSIEFALDFWSPDESYFELRDSLIIEMYQDYIKAQYGN